MVIVVENSVSFTVVVLSSTLTTPNPAAMVSFLVPLVASVSSAVLVAVATSEVETSTEAEIGVASTERTSSEEEVEEGARRRVDELASTREAVEVAAGEADEKSTVADVEALALGDSMTSCLIRRRRWEEGGGRP